MWLSQAVSRLLAQPLLSLLTDARTRFGLAHTWVWKRRPTGYMDTRLQQILPVSPSGKFLLPWQRMSSVAFLISQYLTLSAVWGWTTSPDPCRPLLFPYVDKDGIKVRTW